MFSPIRISSRRLLLICFGIALVCPVVSEGQPDVGSRIDASSAVPDLARTLREVPTSELGLRLAPLSEPELAGLSEAATIQLRALAEALSQSLIDQNRSRASSETSEERRAEIDQQVRALLLEKSELVSRVELVLDAWKQKGGSADSARAYVKVVRGLESTVPIKEESTGTGDQATEAQRSQAELAAAIDEVIAQVQEDPPAHERAEPWKVSVRELELELQPLRLAQMDERVQKWLEILQREVRRRIRIDIALARTEDSRQRAELARRSAEQQEVVKAVVTRLQAALLVFQKRGGDVTEYGNFISTASGQQLSLTDPAVLYAQAMTWLKSRDGGVRLGLNLLKFLGILFAFFVLSRLVARAARTAVGRLPKASSLLRAFLVGMARRVTMIIGLIIALSALGVNITPLVAAIGAAGLVIGLALQGTLSNFASGLLILIYRPYDIGDTIEGGGVSGKVESMNLVSTSILTFDNRVMIVPNNEVWNGVITNSTGRSTRRVDLVFGIGYGDDVDKALELLRTELGGHEKVLPDPAPNVRVHALADNSVNLIARPWVRTQDYWEVYWDLQQRVKKRFDEEGLNIPFPQRDVSFSGPIEVKLSKDAVAGSEGK